MLILYNYKIKLHYIEHVIFCFKDFMTFIHNASLCSSLLNRSQQVLYHIYIDNNYIYFNRSIRTSKALIIKGGVLTKGV